MSTLRVGIAAACATAFFGGCAGVPSEYPYVRPAAALANKPSMNAAFQAGREVEFSAGPLLPRWWTLYKDPNLDLLVEQGIAVNTELRIAAVNIAKAQAGFEYATALGSVTTTVIAAPGYGRRSAQEELLPGGPLPNNFTYALGFGASYQLDLFGQISRAVEAAQADVQASRAAYDAARITVIAEITRAYLESCSAGREAEVAQRLVQVQTQSRELVARAVATGRATSLDDLRSAALEDQVRAKLPQLATRKQLALYRLSTLTGHALSEPSLAALNCVLEPGISKPIPIGDGAALLKRRPDVRKAEDELHGAAARVGVAVSELYPKISLGASVGSVGLDKRFLDDSTFKFSIGPLITWSFPNRSLTKARIHNAEADEQIAYSVFDGVVLRALRETESALTVYARDLDSRALLASSRGRASQAASQTEQLFKAGRLSFLSVLDANRARMQSEEALAVADTKLTVDQVSLFLALGGGWADADADGVAR